MEEKNKYRMMCHLHLHTDYSLLDGAAKAEKYLELAKQYNHPSMAITDHGNMSGTFSFYNSCKEFGIKPIIGMEAYINDEIGEHEEKKEEGKDSHLIILVKNKEGYVNLNKLSYLSFTEGYYRRGRIKLDWLFENKKGLVIGTACVGSVFGRLLFSKKENSEEEAEKIFKRFVDEFGDDFYAEIQINEFEEQKIYNEFIIKMAKKYNVLTVVTGDVHYAKPEDSKLQNVGIAIYQQSSLEKSFAIHAKHLNYTNSEYFHWANKEYNYGYNTEFINECIDNTLKISKKCKFDFEIGVDKYPKYNPTQDVIDYFKTSDNKEIIYKLAHAKLNQRLKEYKKNNIVKIDEEVIKNYRERLNYELKVIGKNNMLDYFLVTWELIKFCDEDDVSHGPGRGCFVPNTRVKMSDGMYCPINMVKIGDDVIDSFGKKQKVIDVLQYEVNEEIVELEFENGKKISCTKEHKFLTKNRGWVEAKNLKNEDDFVIIEYLKTNLKNKNLKKYKGKVCDLTVENSHTYNVEGLGVHNSAAGCLLSYCLGITKIDPIRFKLYFERFLNPTRKSAVDIDIDFEAGTDEKTLQFLYDKYGKERVVSVITFSTFNEKGCLKDVTRAFGQDTGFESDVFAVTKEMPSKFETTLEEWFDEWPNDTNCSKRVKNWLTDQKNREILDITLKMQGQVRNLGKHAAGIVITPTEVWNCIPVNITKGSVVTAFQESSFSKDLSDLGILKLDRLKLETLNIIKEAIKLVREHKNIDITNKVENINLEDKNLYIELLLGNNHGIFQFESSGMNAIVKNMRAENFEELVAANALYRPGPMSIGAHEEYIKNKFLPIREREYAHPTLIPLLEDTKGVLIFQEQLMFIAHEIGGMSLGEGDVLRKAMDKAAKIIAKTSVKEELTKEEKKDKNYKKYLELWDKFKKGAKTKGLNDTEISVVEEWLIKYLGYSFNRSHSVSYTYIAMQTLFLKHYYPTEFYTALLNHPKSGGGKDKEKERMQATILAAISKGIKIVTPTRKSNWGWTMLKENVIAMGFSAIDGMGEVAYDELKKYDIGNMEKQEFFTIPFKKFNKTSFEACLKAKIFDDWSHSREELKEFRKHKIKNSKQLNLFGETQYDAVENVIKSKTFPKTTDEEKEKDFMKVCGADLKLIEKIAYLKQKFYEKKEEDIEPFTKFDNSDKYYYFCLEDIEEKLSKNNRKYYQLMLSDGATKRKMIMWENSYVKRQEILEVGSFYVTKFKKENGWLNFDNEASFVKAPVEPE